MCVHVCVGVLGCVAYMQKSAHYVVTLKSMQSATACCNCAFKLCCYPPRFASGNGSHTVGGGYPLDCLHIAAYSLALAFTTAVVVAAVITRFAKLN